MDVHDWEEITHQQPTAQPIVTNEVERDIVSGLEEFADYLKRLPANDPIMRATWGDGIDGT